MNVTQVVITRMYDYQLNTTVWDVDNDNGIGGNGDDQSEEGVLYGTEHPWFWRVHITALVALGISIIVSIFTIIYLFASGPEKNIFKRKLSERLTLYLAVADILYSTEHSFSHIFSMDAAHKNGTFDSNICFSSGFMFFEFVCGQAIIISITALSTFLMVALNKKITFGRNDWVLLVVSYGSPAVPGIAFAVLGWFGPLGFYCFVNNGSTGGPILALFLSIFLISVAVFIVMCYIGVWITIQMQSRRMSHFQEGDKAKEERLKYHKTAKLLTLFILAYLGQWTPSTIYYVWLFITEPPTVLVNILVVSANMGGVFNFFAYTFVRRSMRQTQRERRDEKNDAASFATATSDT